MADDSRGERMTGNFMAVKYNTESLGGNWRSATAFSELLSRQSGHPIAAEYSVTTL